MGIRGFRLLLGFVLLSLFMISFASAEIFIGSTSGLYNVGDDFNIRISVKSNIDRNAFFSTNLICSSSEGSGEVELHRQALNLGADEEREILISVVLSRSLIEDLNGDCYIHSEFADSSVESTSFEISNKLNLDVDINGAVFEPKEVVEISGTTEKRNGRTVEGFVEVTIPEIGFGVFESVSKGAFEVDFAIPRDASAGKHSLLIRTYDKDSSGEEMNEGLVELSLQIKQIPEEIEIAFNRENGIPEEEFIYTPLLKDQAGDLVKDDLTVSVYDVSGEIVENRVSESGKANSLVLGFDSAPGYWKVEANYGDIRESKNFFVEELEKAEFDLVNDTLTVRNVGNVEYTRAIGVSIGERNEIIEVELGSGESKKFRLYAPDGDYTVGIDDGLDSRFLGNSFLTGNAVSVRDLGKFGGFGGLSVIIWIFILIILLIILAYFYRKMKKGSYQGRSPQTFGKPSNPIMQKLVPTGNSGKGPKSKSLIDRGRVQESQVVALKIKNHAKLKGLKDKSKVIDVLNSALLKSKEAGAKIYSDAEYRILIFAPAVTKERDNTVRAISSAVDIQDTIRDYNKQAIPGERIEFGLGINTGEMVVELKEGKFKFVSLGSIIPLAKKMSEMSKGFVYISEVLHRKSVGKVRVEKSKKGFWKVNEVRGVKKKEEK
jgi:hypothetical protein